MNRYCTAALITTLALLSACSPSHQVGKLNIDTESQSFELGDFRIDTGEQNKVVVSHVDNPEKILWQTVSGHSFLMAAKGQESIHEVKGSFFIDDSISDSCREQTLTSTQQNDEGISLQGKLQCDSGTVLDYELLFHELSDDHLGFRARIANPDYQRIYLHYASEADERFYGFGEQFTYFDLKGKRLPIFIMEQGVGRGAQPFTFLVDMAADSGGKWHTSYAGVPHYMTSKMRSLFLENSQYSVFDMRRDGDVQITLFSNEMRGRILNGDSPLNLIETYTEYAGRMRNLPDWIHEGAILGMQGGTEKIMAAYQRLKEKGGPVSALWLQDWVGQRKTSFGKQLWWNWELDTDRYPGWDKMHDQLEDDGVRLLTYINPFFAQIDDKPNARRNQFRELEQKDFLVKTADGKPYLIENTSFSAGLIDLTNPSAREWVKDVIKEELIAVGSDGWMADFGEALPYDAVLHDGDPAEHHNRYAEEWQRVNREAIEEAGRGEDIVFFSRSGYTLSPGITTLFWLGDQMVTWDKYDGIKTAVTGLLSSGLSGYSFNHSDIGGYTTIPSPVSFLIDHRFRSKELELRWIELNAFTAVFRTHEGNRPEPNHQFDSDEETLDHFARFAKVYKAWDFYRKQLSQDAADKGHPVVRHPWVHFPDDDAVRGLEYQFMLGDEMMVAPVLDPETDSVNVYLPGGDWIHLFSGKKYTSGEGKQFEVDAPIGTPAVFFRDGSRNGSQFRENLIATGVISE